MSLSIYILRLQGGNYYVGKTFDVVKRYQEHLSGQGAQWTRKYKPISLERTIPNASPFDEDKYVKEYMAKYGIDKVRGGSYVSERLDEIQEEALKREIWGAQDKCTRCGHKGHFVKDCFAKVDVDGNTFQEIPPFQSPPFKQQKSVDAELSKANCMRIAEITPTFLSEDEVLDVFINYIRKYKNVYDIYDIPMGIKYKSYTPSIYSRLQQLFPDIEWKITSTSLTTIICRGTLVKNTVHSLPQRQSSQTRNMFLEDPFADPFALAVFLKTGNTDPYGTSILAQHRQQTVVKNPIEKTTYPIQHKIQFQSSPIRLRPEEYEVLPEYQQPSAKLSATHLNSLANERHKRDVQEKVRQILNAIYEQASQKIKWMTFVIPPELEREVLEQLREQFDSSVTFTSKGQLKTSDMRYWWLKYEVSWV